MIKDKTLDDFRQVDKLEERESNLTIFDKFVFRPIGTLIAYALYKYTSVSPNQITLFSVLTTVSAGLALVFGEINLAIFLFLIFPILDCSDGTLARVLKTGNGFGVVVDAMGGYSFISIFWLSIAVYERQTGNFLSEYLALFIMTINLWCRLYLNKKRSVLAGFVRQEKENNQRRSKLYNIYENIEFGSAQIPLFSILVYIDKIIIFIGIYFVVSFMLLMWTMNDIIRSGGSLNVND
jgi:phosphatidylglycerophosphate synthase